MGPCLIAGGVYYPDYPAARLAGKMTVLFMMLAHAISEMPARSGQQKIPGVTVTPWPPGRLHEPAINQLIHTVSDLDDSPGAEINILDYQ
jgi:hypothetical protein